MKPRTRAPAPTGVRCAIYTRKSTEEGLEQEFNTLDAQRESAEAYIQSQTHEGWQCLPARYDDGGFTGGNMERPALKRLLADIEAGQIDCVVVYKVDRLSRSLLDFARMMEVFDKRKVAFVSVTQQFNTGTSMGRLILHVLLSFAQFEREMISERTRDKMAAARRKGKYVGGTPILGYGIDHSAKRLIVDRDEAAKVAAIFALYLEHEALLPVVHELERRGWVNKRWVTQKGQELGGKPFTRTSLHKLLTNVTYLGQVRYKGELHSGQQPAIVEPDVFQRVQATMQHNARNSGVDVRNQHGAILKGILRCGHCQCAMTPSYSSKGKKRYRYYVCSSASKRGWQTCPSKSISAAEIEQFVVDQIRGIGLDPTLVEATMQYAQATARTRMEELDAELSGLAREQVRWHAEMRELAVKADKMPSELARLADLNERIRHCEQRTSQVESELVTLEQSLVDEAEIVAAMGAFEPVWKALTPHEQEKLIRQLIERVDYNGATGKVTITFQPTGIKGLASKREDAA